MSYKNIDQLMEHLNTNGICISGDTQKRQLMNTGYYHGYKGYRFFGKSKNRIPFQSYEEVYATIQYDSKLKALFYEKIMFIETAVKSIALECIMEQANSESIQDMYDKVIRSYNNAPSTASRNEKTKYQKDRFRLEGMVQSHLAKAYNDNNPKITHHYAKPNHSGVPLWALSEIMTLGDFAFLLSCLTHGARDAITNKMGMQVGAIDTDRQLIYLYLYAIKDLRNAIAHNSVIFDTRFRKFEPTPAMRGCLIQEFGLNYINFKSIGDYVILICYYLKLLQAPKGDVEKFVDDFTQIVQDYKQKVNQNVSKQVIHNDWPNRMASLKKSI